MKQFIITFHAEAPDNIDAETIEKMAKWAFRGILFAPTITKIEVAQVSTNLNDLHSP